MSCKVRTARRLGLLTAELTWHLPCEANRLFILRTRRDSSSTACWCRTSARQYAYTRGVSGPERLPMADLHSTLSLNVSPLLNLDFIYVFLFFQLAFKKKNICIRYPPTSFCKIPLRVLKGAYKYDILLLLSSAAVRTECASSSQGPVLQMVQRN